MPSIRHMGWIIMGIAFPFALTLTGCSKPANPTPAAPDALVRAVVGINERIDQHGQLMWSDTSFMDRHAEMQRYADDMDRMMDSLGTILGEAGDCHMNVGGHMMGLRDADATCPDEAALNEVHDEYHRHFGAMQDILDGSNGQGFAEEMEAHFDHMYEHMEDVMRQIDEEYGTGMMMDHGDYIYGHDQDDSTGHHGGGHGTGGM
jgi:hypothetical protein